MAPRPHACSPAERAEGGAAAGGLPDSPDTVTKMLAAAEAGRAAQGAARGAELRCNPAFEGPLQRSPSQQVLAPHSPWRSAALWGPFTRSHAAFPGQNFARSHSLELPAPVVNTWLQPVLVSGAAAASATVT